MEERTSLTTFSVCGGEKTPGRNCRGTSPPATLPEQRRRRTQACPCHCHACLLHLGPTRHLGFKAHHNFSQSPCIYRCKSTSSAHSSQPLQPTDSGRSVVSAQPQAGPVRPSPRRPSIAAGSPMAVPAAAGRPLRLVAAPGHGPQEEGTVGVRPPPPRRRHGRRQRAQAPSRAPRARQRSKVRHLQSSITDSLL